MATQAVDTQITGPSTPSADRTMPPVAKPSMPAVWRMKQYAELTGLPFLCVDADTGTVIAKSDPEVIPLLPPEVQRQLAEVKDIRLVKLPSELTFYLVSLPPAERTPMIGVGYLPSRHDARPHDLVLAAAEENWPQSRLDEWLSRHSPCPLKHLSSLLSMAVRQVRQEERASALQADVEQLVDQIESTYEEISLLHSLTRNLQISRSPVELAELCLERMHALIRPAGNAIWIEEKSGCPHFLMRGNVPVDEENFVRLTARFEKHDWSRPLVMNDLDNAPLEGEPPLRVDFPGLTSLVLVPISERRYRAGWILSCNFSGGREFGTVEASLLSSIATILGTHVRNIDLYRQHDELLLTFVRSLVSTLDAKDPYTRGHSERVALIARRLGQEFQLSEPELHDIYLSGLLHDIGKVGVDDRILRKPGQLTHEEFQEIQKHPMIGFQILKELTNLSKVLPGVRSHHESYNGRGYPDGLTGDDIPIMARILAVADSYDAMGSDRPYREGMPLEKIEEIFQRGAGKQWDAKVIDAYFRARDDVRRICESYTPGNGNLLADKDGGERKAES